MKSFGLIAVMAAAVMMAAPGVHAQAAASGGSTTVTCNDGTSQTVTTTKGACRGHKGINKSASSSSSSGSGSASGNANAAASSAASTSAASSKSSTASGSATKSASSATPAAGGGPGMVWVNTASKTKAYHCQGDKYYGTTKQGQYMTKAQAEAQGYHAAKNSKACG